MKKLFLIYLLMIAVTSHAQSQDGAARVVKLLGKAQKASGLSTRKEDPTSRTAFDRMRLQDPATGQIPSDIHAKELLFFESSLRRDQSQSRVLENLIVWKNRGPFNVGGRTRALAIDVTDENVILAGGVSGGIWRSQNGGESWTKTTGSNELQSVTAIAQDKRPGQAQTWYYTTGEWAGNSAAAFGADYNGDGVFKSTDGGVTWAQLPSTVSDTPQLTDQDFDFNHEIAVSPITGTVVVANYGGLYVSNDQGLLWDKRYTTTGSGWTDVVVGDDGVFYAFVRQLGVVKSIDDGDSWSDISSPSFPTFASFHRGELALAPSNDDVLYLLAEANGTDSGYALWKYNDATGTWVNRSANIPQEEGETGNFDSQGGYDLLITVKPDDEHVVFIGGTNLYRSNNGFASKNQTTWIGGYHPENNSFAVYPQHHPDQHCLVFYPSDPNKSISGNDGGLQRTDDVMAGTDGFFSVVWNPINNGYLTTQAYAVSVGPGNLIAAGFQDNGTWMTLTDNPKADWSDPYSGDGAYNAISSDGRQRYFSSQNANVFRFNYANATEPNAIGAELFSPQNLSNPLFISPLYIDTKDDNVIYLGGTTSLNVNTKAKTGTSTSGWKTIGLTGTSGKISEMGIIGNGALYVGTSGGKLYKITGAKTSSPTVTNISNALFASRYISGIAVNPDDSDELLVTVSNYSVKSIFHSTNGGSSWTDVGGNLEENTSGLGNGPSIRCVRIVGNSRLYLVGTSVGLFSTKTLNGASTVWEQENINGLGSLVVEHIAVRQADGLVVAGTHGNGIFSARFAVKQKDLAVDAFEAPQSAVLSNSEVISLKVTNLGVQTVTSFDVGYAVDGVEQQLTTVTNQSLASGDSYVHNFTQTQDFSEAGDYTLLGSVELSGDENSVNNQLIKEVISFARVDSFPYEASFETGNEGWQPSGLWELGTPNDSLLDRASEGLVAWVTDLDADYTPYVTAKLLSPVFDFSSLKFPIVSFDLAYATEADWDGMVLAYRTDLTNEKFKVIEKDKGIANWYNGFADVFGYSAWTGKQADFVEASGNLEFLAGEPHVQFAFIFASDALENDEGFAMDRFQIYEDLTIDNQISLSNNVIAENKMANSLVGTLSTAEATGAVTYSFDNDAGGVDNASFMLQGAELRAKAPFNFEAKNRYLVQIKGEDESATVFKSTFYINVQNADDPILGVILSNFSVIENSPAGTTVGTLSAQDEDLSELHSFSLVAGAGDDDNSQFGILGNELRTSKKFDFETKNSYSILVSAKSATSSGQAERTFSIDILDGNDVPTDLIISRHTIPDFEPAGYSVGAFSATDADGDALSYALASGAGGEDNVRFIVQGTDLITEEGADFSVQPKYRVLVETNDGKGGFLIAPFEISVEELLGLLDLGKMGVSVSPNPTSDYLNVKIANSTVAAGYVAVSTLDGKQLQRLDFSKDDFVYKAKLDLSALSQGVYVLTVEVGNRCARGRVVKY